LYDRVPGLKKSQLEAPFTSDSVQGHDTWTVIPRLWEVQQTIMPVAEWLMS
jgi:hypothetical protein